MTRQIIRVLLVLAAGMAGVAAAADAQVAVGAGIAAAENGGGRGGVSAFVRVGWPRLPVVLDASILSLSGLPPVEYFCPVTGPCAVNVPYEGPTTALTLAPAIQLAQRSDGGWVLYRVGPSVSWFADREAGSPAAAAGLRAGISLRLGRGNSGLLLSGDYYRLFRGSTRPRWVLPITLGWQF